MMNYQGAYPTGIEEAALQNANLEYGGIYVVTASSSTGNPADLAGIKCKEVVNIADDDANTLGIQWPGITREFMLNGSGMFNDTILTPKQLVDQQVAQLREGDLPARLQTTQKLFWKERNSDTWHEFDEQVIEFQVVRYKGALKAYTEYQGELLSQNYTGPAPQ
jgi:hypothetical protein